QARSATMASSRAFALVLLLCALSCHAAVSYAPVPAKDDFFGCLVKEIPARLLYAKSSPAFPTVLAQTIRNSRWSSPQNVKPLYIITPTNASHIQSAVVCGRRHSVRLRVRSGGHDYEGLSYRSEKPETFAVVDLNKMRAVSVDGYARTAWVDSGAQLGELYYAIAKNSLVLAFPAGVCPTIGVGGNCRRRLRHAAAQVRHRRRERHRRQGGRRQRQAARQELHERRPLLGRQGRRRRELRHRGVVAGEAPAGASYRDRVQDPQDSESRRRRPHRQVATGRAGPSRRPHDPHPRYGGHRDVRGHVPGHLQNPDAADEQQIPRAWHELLALQRDALDQDHPLHPPWQAGHPGRPPQPEQQLQTLRRIQVGLRLPARPQACVGADLIRLAREARSGDDGHGPLWRHHQRHPRSGDAVPSPQGRPLQHPVR
uniref:FAD-binding PCMH-type domain-containing protein n=2 Tax=Aegilops tauschii subsp. strangulata TaxID=200361 RepID=A0A453SET3_AEGTS